LKCRCGIVSFCKAIVIVDHVNLVVMGYAFV
jgi:hypothetical protein